MNYFWSIVIGGLVVISLIVLGFTLLQIQEQKAYLVSDLDYRTQILSESLKESIEPVYSTKDHDGLREILDRFANKQEITGLVIYDHQGNYLVSSKNIDDEAIKSLLPIQVINSNSAAGTFLTTKNNKVYQFAEPLYQDGNIVGVLMIIQWSDYIDEAINQIWRTNLLRLLVQVLVFVFVVTVIIRWFIIMPVASMIKSIKLMRSGQLERLDALQKNSLFKPLADEVSKISASLLRARSAASQEARLRMEKIDTPWTEDRLKEFMKAYLKDRKLFVISNREPYVHSKVKSEIKYSIPASGMVTALEPLMEACGGMWLAQATGDADKETSDLEGKLQVPPDDPKYTLKRIWLSPKEQKGFYVGFSNEALWPLCHTVHTRPIFRKEDWLEYRRVNGKFVQSLLSEIKEAQKPLILVQDFHFALLSQMIKKSRPDARVGLFWHVPWPSPETFNICPFKKEILEGMLGADVVGFHTQQYCNNFMNTVSKGIESIADFEQFTITLRSHQSYIRPFPISIAFTESGGKNNSELERGKKLLDQFGVKTKYVGLGVDRMDYTKGILERFRGIEFFFDSYQNYKNQLTFLQIAPPSREVVERYRRFNEDVTMEAERINKKLSQNGWKPIVLVKEHLSHKDLYSLYRAANFCLVTSLHDGMNLVAKEFVAARNDESGVIILSQFVGASRDLKEAVIVNPYSAEQTSKAIYDALNMPLAQQHQAMKKMREAVKNYNVYRWSAEFMKAVASLE